MPITAREAALKALERCRRDNAWSSEVIDKLINKNEMDRREAALASWLCLGVLQNGLLCDYYIDAYCTVKLEPKVRDILRLGVYQLLMTDRIPARAAVNESVALCKSAGCERAKGVVNAILRKISDNKDKLPSLPPYGSVEYLGIRYSFPVWLVKRLVGERGYEFTEAFFACCNEPPKLNINLNSLKIDERDYIRALERVGISYTAVDGVPGCLKLEGGTVPELPGYEEGLFYVQDSAARRAVDMAAPLPDMNVLDACSAPGGKAFAAALRMQNTGSILSCDIHEKKLALVRSGAERLGIDIISTRVMDARSFSGTLNACFDLVIADVPCSGFGVIGKKPEIRFKSETDIAALPKLQLAILSNLAKYVKLGGTLLYSTCTVLKAENEGVIECFLSKESAYQLSEMRTFFPNVDGTDGFFAATLKRVQ